MDLTYYSVGALPLDACKSYHKEVKYRFFVDSYIFHSYLYINLREQIDYASKSAFRPVKSREFAFYLSCAMSGIYRNTVFNV
jgi:hypothetical protein